MLTGVLFSLVLWVLIVLVVIWLVDR